MRFVSVTSNAQVMHVAVYSYSLLGEVCHGLENMITLYTDIPQSSYRYIGCSPLIHHVLRSFMHLAN